MKLVRFLAIFLIMLVNSPFVSADIFFNAQIPESYLSVEPGGQVYANINIINSDGNIERMDYLVEGYIFDVYGNSLLEKRKSIAVQNRVSTSISFNIPEELKPGAYRLKAVMGGDEVSLGFVIEERAGKITERQIIFFILILLIIAFLALFYFYNRKINKLLKNKKRVGVEDFVMFG